MSAVWKGHERHAVDKAGLISGCIKSCCCSKWPHLMRGASTNHLLAMCCCTSLTQKSSSTPWRIIYPGFKEHIVKLCVWTCSLPVFSWHGRHVNSLPPMLHWWKEPPVEMAFFLALTFLFVQNIAGEGWDAGLQPGHVSISDLSTWPLIGICSVYLLTDVYLGWIHLDDLLCFSSGLERFPCVSGLAMRLTWLEVLSGLRRFKQLGWVILFLWDMLQVEVSFKLKESLLA